MCGVDFDAAMMNISELERLTVGSAFFSSAESFVVELNFLFA